MAGWIKMRKDLAEDIKVETIAELLGADVDLVVGKLHRLWSWADTHARGEDVEGLALLWIDRKVRHPGFAEALVAVGWIRATPKGFTLVNFSEHNWPEGKERAMATARKSAERERERKAKPGKRGRAGRGNGAKDAADPAADHAHDDVTGMSRSDRDTCHAPVTVVSQPGHADVPADARSDGTDARPTHPTTPGGGGRFPGAAPSPSSPPPRPVAGTPDVTPMSRAGRDGIRDGIVTEPSENRDPPRPTPVPPGREIPLPPSGSGEGDGASNAVDYSDVIVQRDRYTASMRQDLFKPAQKLAREYDRMTRTQNAGGGHIDALNTMAHGIPYEFLLGCVRRFARHLDRTEVPLSKRVGTKTFFGEEKWRSFTLDARDQPATSAPKPVAPAPKLSAEDKAVVAEMIRKEREGRGDA